MKTPRKVTRVSIESVLTCLYILLAMGLLVWSHAGKPPLRPYAWYHMAGGLRAIARSAGVLALKSEAAYYRAVAKSSLAG